MTATATYPDFGKELQRSFGVHENCYNCAGFYDGCVAWPAEREFACGVYNPLPDVPAGTCGQKSPGVRCSPEGRHKTGPVRSTGTSRSSRSRTGQPRRPSPAGTPTGDGERLCECGVTLPRRRRCCDACRLTRRQETLHGRRRTKRAPFGAADAASGLRFTGPGTASIAAGSPAHN